MKTELDVAHHTPEAGKLKPFCAVAYTVGFVLLPARHTRNCMMNGMAQEGEFT